MYFMLHFLMQWHCFEPYPGQKFVEKMLIYFAVKGSCSSFSVYMKVNLDEMDKNVPLSIVCIHFSIYSKSSPIKSHCLLGTVEYFHS